MEILAASDGMKHDHSKNPKQLNNGRYLDSGLSLSCLSPLRPVRDFPPADTRSQLGKLAMLRKSLNIDIALQPSVANLMLHKYTQGHFADSTVTH